MGRKIVVLILIFCFCIFITSSAFGATTEEAEDDRKQQKQVLALIGLCALVGTIFMLSAMDDNEFVDSYYSAFLKNEDEEGFRFSLDFHDGTLGNQYVQNFADDTTLTPVLKLNYAW